MGLLVTSRVQETPINVYKMARPTAKQASILSHALYCKKSKNSQKGTSIEESS